MNRKPGRDRPDHSHTRPKTPARKTRQQASRAVDGSQRDRPGPEAGLFADILGRLVRGEAITESDRYQLSALLTDLLRGADVRERFVKRREGRPSDYANIDGFVAAAVELLPGKRAAALVEVAQAWNLSEAVVKRLHLLARAEASAWIEREGPESVAAVVGWHRARWLETRR